MDSGNVCQLKDISQCVYLSLPVYAQGGTELTFTDFFWTLYTIGKEFTALKQLNTNEVTTKSAPIQEPKDACLADRNIANLFSRRLFVLDEDTL